MSDPRNSKVERCSMCNKELVTGKEANSYAPFCSKRCADIDLGRWLKGSYAVPEIEGEAGFLLAEENRSPYEEEG